MRFGTYALALFALSAASLASATARAQDQGTPIGVDPAAAPSSAPAPAPAPSEPAVADGGKAAKPPAYYEPPAPEQSWPDRKGFTLELGLGASYTTVAGAGAIDGGFGLAPLSLSVGGFVSKRVAIAARMAGTSFFEDLSTYRNGRVSRESQQVANGYFGPVLQVFLNDYIFLGGGAGLAVLYVNPLATTSSRVPDPVLGFALTARAGFGFFAKRHHWLGVVLEAYPAFYERNDGGDTSNSRAAFGTAAILQWQYY